MKKVLWRCRRGTRELDIILGKFVRQSFDSLDNSDKEQFDLLLDVQDPVLTGWLCQDISPPDEFKAIVSRIVSTYP